MSNRGTLIGTTQPQIQFYEPKIVCAANSGTPTNPDLTTIDGHSYQFGRFVQISPALVYVEIQLQFLGAEGGSSGSVGSGGVYCFSLPPEFPLRRENPGQIDRTAFSPGAGMCYLSFGSATVPDVNVECVPVPADPWATLNGTEDGYFSLQAPYILDWGTWAVPASNSSVTVAHDVGFAFNASDIEVLTPTGGAANAPQVVSVANITSTHFDVNTRQNIGSGLTFFGAWKVRAEPPTGQAGPLVGPGVPWGWDKVTKFSPFGNFFVTLLYEPQT